MGSNFNVSCYNITVWIVILNLSWLSSFSLAINNSISHTIPSSLDDYFYSYSSKSISRKPHTGVLYNISLPAKFSGVKVSVLRLRSSTLWARGANFSSFDIPPRIITMPYVRRLAVMYENMGNLSSHYYELPGYTFLSTVVGFAIYTATDLSGNTTPQRLNITTAGQPIRVMFHDQLKVPQGKNMKLIKCVRFDPTSHRAELSDMVRPNVCLTRALGHFGVAIRGVIGPKLSPSPSASSPVELEGSKSGVWKWWVTGVAGGLVGLVFLVSSALLCCRTFGSQKITRMERKAEKSESLATRWIGGSKMPSASVTRTQAVLENDFAP